MRKTRRQGWISLRLDINNQHARFAAVDPLLSSGQSVNPQTFNRYVYCLNNPLIFTDPTGLQVATTPGGRWYKPSVPDGTKTYRFEASQPKGYEPVTRRNRNGHLVGSIQGSTILNFNEGEEYWYEDYVVRFNEEGPHRAVPVVDVQTGKTSMGVLSDFERNGFEIIQADTYSMVHPSTGAVYNAIEPHDVALAFTPLKFSAGKRFTFSRTPKKPIAVIGELEHTRYRAGLTGSEVFLTNSWNPRLQLAWIKSVAQRRLTVEFATEPVEKAIYNIDGTLTEFGKEYLFLTNQGYTRYGTQFFLPPKP